MIEQAFILAAGLGRRMLPLTEKTPKPLLKIQGKSLLQHLLQALQGLGTIRHVLVNAYFLGDQIKAELDHLRPLYPFKLELVTEDQLLDTGGSITNILPLIDAEKPLLVTSGDTFWDPSGPNLLRSLCADWNPDQMDFMIQLQDNNAATLTQGSPDYDWVGGYPHRSLNKTGRYGFTSLRILKPQLFEPFPVEAFSQLVVMDACQATGRLAASFIQDGWLHVSTPEDYYAIKKVLEVTS